MVIRQTVFNLFESLFCLRQAIKVRFINLIVYKLLIIDYVSLFNQLRQFRRASKAHAHHMSEEEKKKRKKSAKKVEIS